MRGESGCGRELGSSPSTAPLSAPGCCVGGGTGDCAAPAPGAPAPVDAAMEAGIGGEVVFLDILARAGAALEMPGGGVAGELSW